MAFTSIRPIVVAVMFVLGLLTVMLPPLVQGTRPFGFWESDSGEFSYGSFNMEMDDMPLEEQLKLMHLDESADIDFRELENIQ
ncbi:hypothetical protein O6H91_12G054700 [Diphasiastrum complanatum]|uniref:Uncharacterized protein n=1 Tax=Diphasiastrum complanatum TaxID=34168 RepID=A0ACC2C1V9_DIPCM|nr:hypothetical protein O6H91_12G054700 [Diphasiastrum complanatum]